ncbi:hypothetical protein [Streptomyces sp. NPDC051000]|uniref:hypothetical protein n=1 Tax=Streptomyces sp. NPDC051000 TaxID=3155520 RepID=UPI0033F11FC1
MSGIRLWGSGRRPDGPMAVIVGVGNLLVSSVLVMMMIGGPWFFEATTRQEETAGWETAIPIFVGWLVGGLALFLVLGMTRTAVSHIITMLFPPTALVAILLAL